MKFPEPLFNKSPRGILLFNEFTKREFELPMHWRILEFVGKPPKKQLRAPTLGVWRRADAVARCLEGIPSKVAEGSVAKGIVGVPFIPIYDSEGNYIWWYLLHNDRKELKHG